MRNMSFSKTLLLTVTLTLVLAFSGLAGAQTIKFGYVLWDSEIASTNVVAAIVEDYLDYDVELIALDAGPMWAGIAQGEFDATVAAWLPATHEHYYSEYWTRVENLGPSLHGAAIGLVVPEYVDLDSIEDLNGARQQLGGRIVGIDPGAGIMSAAEEALDEYNLDLMLMDGSDAAMTAALSSAISRNEWIVITGWTPHWKFAEWDLKYLDDPKGVFGEEEHIAKIVTPELREKAPDVFNFLNKFYWTQDDMGAVMLDILDGAEPADAARAWIAANEDVVQSWLD